MASSFSYYNSTVVDIVRLDKLTHPCFKQHDLGNIVLELNYNLSLESLRIVEQLRELLILFTNHNFYYCNNGLTFVQ